MTNQVRVKRRLLSVAFLCPLIAAGLMVLPAKGGPGKIASIPLGDWGCPGDIAINSAIRRAYVPDQCTLELSVIDLETEMRVTYPIIGKGHADIAVNHLTNRVYLSDRGPDTSQDQVLVLNGTTLEALASVGLAQGGAGAIAVNYNTNRIYVADYWNGSVAVIDGNTNSAIGVVSTGEGTHPWDISVNSRTNRIYVNCGPNLCMIDGASNRVVARRTVSPYWLLHFAVDEEDDRVFVTESFGERLYEIDGATLEPLRSVYTPGDFQDPVYNPYTRRIYATQGERYGSSSIVSIDRDTFQIIEETPIGGYLLGIASYAPAYRLLVVENSGSQVLVVTEDAIPPRSTLSLQAGQLLKPGQQIAGTVTDDMSGVDKVMVDFSLGTMKETKEAALNCSPDRKTCAWATTAPSVSGAYLVQVHAVDRAGSQEIIGPSTKSPHGPYAVMTVL